MLLLLAMIAGLVALNIFAGSGCGFNFFYVIKLFSLKVVLQVDFIIVLVPFRVQIINIHFTTTSYHRYPCNFQLSRIFKILKVLFQSDKTLLTVQSTTLASDLMQSIFPSLLL